MRRIVTIALVCLTALAVTPHATSAAPGGHWPQWRGPLGSGMAPDATPPVEWSEDHNIRWRVDAPGQGHSSPIVWGDSIYLLAAADVESGLVRYSVVAIDRANGETRWERVAIEAAPHEGIHQTSARASASAVTDGSRVFASFGSYGVYAYTVDGDPLWDTDLGDMTTRNEFGEGASPALYGERLVVPWDHEGASFIVALDAATGAEVWRKDRDERTSWNTPLVVEHDGRQQVIVNATNLVRSYDLADGSLIWECSGMTANAIPSPVHADGTVYVMSGFRGSALFAIDLDRASGDITNSDAFVWSKGRDTPYVPSPLLTGDTLYYVKGNNAMLSAVNALTGEPRYPLQRLEGLKDVYSSPVSADGRVYLADRDGATIVIDGGAEFTVLATNRLDDKFSATPALVDGEIYLRGERYLYCIAAD
jgi:outer membrane protein assembly factor BamB